MDYCKRWSGEDLRWEDTILDIKKVIEKFEYLAAGAPFGNISYGCTGAEIADMFRMAAQALREKQEYENPKSLTIEELKTRVNTPVWIESMDKERKRWTILTPFYVFDGYGQTWLAYNKPPKS